VALSAVVHVKFLSVRPQQFLLLNLAANVFTHSLMATTPSHLRVPQSELIFLQSVAVAEADRTVQVVVAPVDFLKVVGLTHQVL
jgi:hypothetical protein